MTKGNVWLLPATEPGMATLSTWQRNGAMGSYVCSEEQYRSTVTWRVRGRAGEHSSFDGWKFHANTLPCSNMSSCDWSKLEDETNYLSAAGYWIENPLMLR